MLKKKRKPITFSVFVCILFLLGGCATAPTHDALQSSVLPELIPLRDFIANTDSNFNYQISPDGKKLAWIAVKGTQLTIFFRTLDGDTTQSIDTHSDDSIFSFQWAQDSQTLLFHQDTDGDENYHVYSVSINQPDALPVDLTPIEDIQATIVAIPRKDPEHIFIKHNGRDKTVFDLFRLSLKTVELEEISRNQGDTYNWLIDEKGKLRGRFRKLTDTINRFERLSEDGNRWIKTLDWDFDDFFTVAGFTDDPDFLWVLSNLDRDKVSLFKMDLRDSSMHHFYSEQDIDLDGVYISKITDKPLFVTSMPDYPRIHFFDSEVESEFNLVKQRFKKYLNIVSGDNSERTIIVTASSEKDQSHYLYQRDTGKMTLLGTAPLSRYAPILSTTTPVSFTSRDGLNIHGYLTIPKGLEGKTLPMVLRVHGGPWARDRYGMNESVQFLANRGYAVLQINYRGSTGYGKKFMEAAIGEFGAKMHNDLIDGVNWAIDEGIADRNKICILGGSYGGYAALVGMSFTPEVFACGVDVVGPSNLVSLLETTPVYWKYIMPFFYKYVGDPAIAEQRKEMEGRSPLFKVNNVQNPLLIVQGANDPRVKQQESDQIVKALRDSGKEVEYLLFEDEGHGIQKWTNNLVYFRKMEDFLAKHLGGRSAGFDYYELAIPFF